MIAVVEQWSDAELALAAAVLGLSGAWLIAVGLVDVVRRPAEPEAESPTLDLGPESPAVANFLTHGFAVTAEAVPATLLDLAARGVVELEERGFGNYVCRLEPSSVSSLLSYERRVLKLLQERVSGGIVPAEGLSTGPEEHASKWFGKFDREVVADAQRQGLSRDNVSTGVFSILTAAAAGPALLVWALSGLQAGSFYMVVAVGILGAVRRRHRQRETPAGLAAASRWLGVRASLDNEDGFGASPPIAVAFWKRHLAYGAALGIAPGAIRPIPMGSESDTSAWSSYGGRWRPVRVSYPSLLPPAWGMNPLAALVAAVGAGFVVVLGLVFVVPAFIDVFSGTGLQVPVGVALVLPAAAAGLGALVLVARALADLSSRDELSGEIIRLRVRGSEKKPRYFVAVDDGTSSYIRALRVDPRVYVTLEQGQLITVSCTRHLRHVWSIMRASSESMRANYKG